MPDLSQLPIYVKQPNSVRILFYFYPPKTFYHQV
nr:MAG TPA: hypothetical protein [Caudoviricetes sp.]